MSAYHATTTGRPGRWPAIVLSLLATLLLAGPRPVAQIYVYGLGEKGHNSVNGAGLGRLLSGFERDDDNFLGVTITKHGDEKWWDLVVDGPDRYALRIDGRVSKNGSRLFTMGFGNLGDHSWASLTLNAGDVWALRTDGRLSRNGAKVVTFDKGAHSFRKIVSDGVHVYSLRTDGALYVDDDKTPVYRLDGPGPDGDTPSREWRDMTVDGPRLLVLRRDGTLVSAATDGSDPLEGVEVADLPYSGSLTEARTYVDVTVRPDGHWLVMRGSGKIYSSELGGDLLTDLPSGPAQDMRHRYMRIIAVGNTFVVLRRDGRIYRDVDPEPLVDLRDLRYRGLAVSTDPPDLGEVKNQRPKVTRYRTVALAGQPLVVPFRAVDRDLAAADLVVTPDLETLPPGASWDPVGRCLVWDAPGSPGRYKFRLEVDDGVGKPVKVAYPIKVLALHTAAANKPPRPARIGKARGHLQQPLTLPILAVDPDGDALTIELDPETAPAGAVFDGATNTLTWTPAYDQLGRHKLRFLVDDGTTTRKLRVKILIEASFLPF